MTTRRMVLKIGGAAALVSVAGGGLFLHGGGLGKARAPWSHAGTSFGDKRLDALAFAILAPNPHNRQPWMFSLSGADKIIIHCDLKKRLPETDPFDRQITIGFGGLLELLDMAAAHMGLATKTVLFPQGLEGARLNESPIAEVSFVGATDKTDDPLFDLVLQRRTSRNVFNNTPVPEDVLAAVLKAETSGGAISLGGTIEPRRVGEIKDLARQGWQIEYETQATRRESICLMRIGNRAVNENPDGISLGGMAMGAMGASRMLTREALDRPGSTAFKASLNSYFRLIESARGFVFVTSADNSRASQIAAGRAWLRLNLRAQSLGIGVQPLSQILQEFPEMAGPYSQIHQQLLGEGQGVVQMLGRIGYGPKQAPSPRFPLEAKLYKA
jgi:nitroreductase